MYLNMSRIFQFFSFSRPNNFRSWVSNKIYLQFHSIRLSYLNKHPDTVIVLHRYFSKGDFPSDNFPSGNFPNVQFPRQQPSKG